MDMDMDILKMIIYGVIPMTLTLNEIMKYIDVLELSRIVEGYILPKNGNVCFTGYYELSNKIIGRMKIQKGLREACSGGNVEIVSLMIKKGARNLNCGLIIACTNGDIPIINLLIYRGASNLNHCLIIAIRNNHVEAVKVLLAKGAYGINHGFNISCRSGDVRMIRLMLEAGATNLSEGLKTAVRFKKYTQYITAIRHAGGAKYSYRR